MALLEFLVGSEKIAEPSYVNRGKQFVLRNFSELSILSETSFLVSIGRVETVLVDER